MTPRLIIFFIAVAGYAAYQLSGLVHKPQLIIADPTDGAALAAELVVIRGRADGVTKLTANDEPLMLDENSAFETKLLLAPGYNIIRFSGDDRFGRTIEKKLQLNYKDKTHG
ncbi:MAG: hypothetical protein HYT46_03825 [Candidatus Vogelbacteria bacterium]|nr:hypothetical protein [Candidatus Vogelbacteria bacterium]